MTKKKVQFVGKEVFIGIDVHRANYVLVAICEGDQVFKISCPANPRSLVCLVQQRFKGALVCTAYEAGFSGFVLHRELERAGIKSIVVNAASIEIAARDKVKTDRRDAHKLAVKLSKGELQSIRIPSEEQELSRVLTRTREQLVEQRTSVMNQIRMKLHQFGMIPVGHNKALCLSYVQSFLKSGILPKELAIGVEALVNLWVSINDNIKKIKKELKAQAAQDANEARYRTAPGVGPLSARVLSNELGDMSQFSNERQLSSFVGLTPSEFSTGTKVHKGHISRQGSGRIRRILNQMAWRAIGKDESLMVVYKRIATRAGGKRAIVAVARKLLVRLRAMFVHGKDYEMPLVKSMAIAA